MRKTTACALFLALLTLPTRAQQPPALEPSMDRIRDAAEWFPPRFASESERTEVLALWHVLESGLLSTLQNPEARYSTEILLGDLYRMGHNLDIPGASEKTVSHLTAAAALNPRDPKPHLILGRHLTFKGDFHQGELELLRAYALSPANELTDLNFLLAKNYYYQSQFALCMLFADRIPSDHPASSALAVQRAAASKALATGVAPKTIEIRDADPKAKTDVILIQ